MADNIVAPSVDREQSMVKKFAVCKIELTPHLMVTWKLLGRVTLWVKKSRLKKQWTIISEELKKEVKWHQEGINLKEMIVI